MQIALTLFLTASIATSPPLECASKYMKSMDADIIHAVAELHGLDDYMVSAEKEAISVGLAERCSKEERLVLSRFGVRYPENQLEVLTQAVFLVIKYHGDFDVFVDYLATEYARWEDSSDSQPATQNAACANDFQVLGNHLQIWTPGQLMSRLYPVGVCPDRKTFWLFQKSIGWRRLDPYERAEICTTLKLQDGGAAGYCTE